MVSLIDLSPTILKILDIPTPSEWYGGNLLSEKEKPVICEDVRHGYKCYSVRTKDWVYAYNEDTNHKYLFKRMPENKKDLSDERFDVMEHMHGLLQIHKEKIEECWREYLKNDIDGIIQRDIGVLNI